VFFEVLHISLALMFIYCWKKSLWNGYILFLFSMIKCVKFTHWNLGYISGIGLMNSFTSIFYPYSYNIIFKSWMNIIQWNQDFTFLKGPFKLNVKSRKWKFM
jgi:hypothetical protein